MKICVLSRSTPLHFASGGMEKHCWIICNGFAKIGFQVSLITTAHPSEEVNYTKVNDNFEIFFLQGTKPGKYSNKYWKKSLDKFLELNKRYNFDIIFSESAGALSIVKYKVTDELKVPIIFRMAGTALRDAFSQFKLLTLRSLAASVKDLFCHFRDKKWFRYVEGFIACSNEIKENMVRYLNIPENKISVIYNGVDTVKFFPYPINRKRDLRSKYNIGSDDLVILTVGRLKREKGIHFLIFAVSEILKNFKNIKLLIVGDGHYKTNLMKLVSKLKLEKIVQFLNFIPNERLPEIYNISDIFVFPSVAKEGFPFVIIEAMACKLPVIASKVGGVSEIIKNQENGLLVIPGDIEDLKKNIVQVLTDLQLKKKISSNAYSLVIQEFTEDVMVKKTVEFLKQYVTLY